MWAIFIVWCRIFVGQTKINFFSISFFFSSKLKNIYINICIVRLPIVSERDEQKITVIAQFFNGFITVFYAFNFSFRTHSTPYILCISQLNYNKRSEQWEALLVFFVSIRVFSSSSPFFFCPFCSETLFGVVYLALCSYRKRLVGS